MECGPLVPKIFEMPNGVELEFSDDTPEEEMFRQADAFISQMAHQQDQRPKKGPGGNPLDFESPEHMGQGIAGEKMRDVGRNLGAGAGESLQNARDFISPLTKLSNPKLMGNQERPDFQGMFGVNDQNRNNFVQGIPETALSVMFPALGLEGLAAKAGTGLVGKGLRTALKAAETGGVQSLFGATFNPESREESAKEQGKWGAGGSLISSIIGDQNPASKFIRKVLPSAVGTWVGYKAGEHLPGWGQLLTTLGGGITGHKAGTLARKLMGDVDQFGRPYAQEAKNSMTKLAQKEYDAAHKASQSTGVPLMLHEKTANPLHKGQQKKLLSNERNIQKAHEFKGKRKSTIEANKNEASEKLFPLEEEVEERLASLENLDDISDIKKEYKKQYDLAKNERIDKVYNEAYESAPHKKVEAAIDEFIDKPIYEEAYNKFIKNAADRTKYKGVDIHSLKAQDKIHRNISDHIDYMKAHPDKYSPETIHTYEQFDRDFVKKLDKASNNNKYKIARTEYSKSLLADKLRESTPAQFTKMMKDEKSFGDFYKGAEGDKGLQKTFVDLRTVFQKIDPIKLDSVAKALPSKSMSNYVTHPVKTARSLVEHLIDKNYKEAAMDIVLHPEAAKEIHRMAGISNPNKLARALVEMGTKIKGHEAAKQLNISHNYNAPEYKKMEKAK
jgi:hypothetical protein